MTRHRTLRVGLAIVGLWAGLTLAADAQGRAGGAPSVPFTYLLDTGEPSSEPVRGDAFAKRHTWRQLPEGEVAHEFSGDAVFLNDRIAVVLRASGAGAEVYSRTPTGMTLRTTLGPGSAGGARPMGISAVRIVENGPSAVMLDASFAMEGGRSASLALRLTTGEVILEARPGQGTGRLIITGQTRYVVVPEFFGDDMVFGADAFDAPRVGLPVESFFLNLLEGGDAIVMCVWQSGERNADVVFTGGPGARAVKACEIESKEGESVWIAILEGPDIWHGRAISQGDEGTEVALDWQPPFLARWRGSLVGEEGVADSWAFLDEREREQKERPVAPLIAEPVNPCWLESDRAFVRVPSSGSPTGHRSVTGAYEALIVYPLDRSRATPLTVFCPVDVMRNALGVGPCQYILDAEGFGSDAAATPDEVTRWIERLFERKRDEREEDAIGERLEQMVRHIEHVRTRIEGYGEFAREVQGLCENGGESEDVVVTARKLREIAAEIERSATRRRVEMANASQARQLADAMAALIGGENALAECRALGAALRTIGAAQDNALATCRMAVRRLKQRCRTAAARHPGAADLAKKVQELAEQMLRKKR